MEQHLLQPQTGGMALSPSPCGLQTKAAAVHSGSECLESLRGWDNLGGLYYACHCPLLMHCSSMQETGWSVESYAGSKGAAFKSELVSAYNSRSQAIIQGSQERNSKQELMQRPWRSATSVLVPHGMLSLPFLYYPEPPGVAPPTVAGPSHTNH